MCPVSVSFKVPEARSQILIVRSLEAEATQVPSEEKSTCYNDAWSFSPIDMQWTPRTSDAITWFARSGHSATFSRGKMFTFGGCQLFRECYSDVAALDTLDACPNRCGGNGECVPKIGRAHV